MRRRDLLLGGAAVAMAAAGGARAAPMRFVARAITPPVTPKRPLRIDQLGRVRVDDYAWLKDPNWKQVWRDPAKLQPEIRRHLEAENAYAEAVLAPTEPLQKQLEAEMQARSDGDAAPPLSPDGPWAYGQRPGAGGQLPAYVRRPVAGGPEQVLLDVGARAAGHGFFNVVNAAHSPDHNLFAWAEDDLGSENFKIQVKDLATGEILPGPAEHAFGDFVFSPDSRWIFWTWRDLNSRPTKIFRRPARGGPDVLVYQETDPAFLITVTRAASGQYVMIRAWNAETAEVRLIPGADPQAEPRVVEPRTRGLVYSVEPWGDRLAILTNADGAVDFKLVWADPAAPGRASWRDWVPHRPGRFITGMRAFEDHFVRTERADADPGVVICDQALRERPVAFEEAAYAVDLDPSDAYATRTVRLVYSSPRTPKQWLDYDMDTGRPRRVKAVSVPNFRSGDYLVERLFATAPDGAKVPITVLRRAGVSLDANAPLFLYGYGAYGVATDADFSVPRLSLVDRGWVWAIAHVRGGSDKGWSWFLAARRGTKVRSFTDFIACAEHLAQAGYTRRGRIVAHGFSAGGLLVGASMNMRPDLWSGVIGQAPFVDVLNTMSDASHPLVPLARPDWGDPLADPAAYDWIASYSPYDNVAPRPYPTVLATTAVTDDRVGYWEPAKWIAKLRACTTSGRPVMLMTAMAGGHAGGAALDDELARSALFNAFAIWAVDTAPSAGPRA